jgi:transcriptional regulator with XRE-family HTH domain
MRQAREREDFSKRLAEALKKHGLPGSPTELARRFNTRFPGSKVTPQAARKWLAGESIPSQDRIQALASWLGVGAAWLRFGEEAGASAARQPAKTYGPSLSDQELIKRYRRLSIDSQQALAEIITALAEKSRGG